MSSDPTSIAPSENPRRELHEAKLTFTDGIAFCFGPVGAVACAIVFMLLPSSEAVAAAERAGRGYGSFPLFLGAVVAGAGSISCFIAAAMIGASSRRRLILAVILLALCGVGIYGVGTCLRLPTGEHGP